MNGADIQIDNGDFTRIHWAILEVMARTKLSDYEHRCVWFLLRKTYGWNKREDAISLAQWEEGTGIERRNVSRTLKKLEAKHIIYRTEVGTGRSNVVTYGFNKYIEQWETVSTETPFDGGETVSVRTPFTDEETVSTETPFVQETVSVRTLETVSVRTPTIDSNKQQQQQHDADAPTVTPNGEYYRVFRELLPARQFDLTGAQVGMVNNWADKFTIEEFRAAVAKASTATGNAVRYLEKVLEAPPAKPRGPVKLDFVVGNIR